LVLVSTKNIFWEEALYVHLVFLRGFQLRTFLGKKHFTCIVVCMNVYELIYR